MIYLDNTATTPLCEEAKAGIAEALDVFGNPSSLHRMGLNAQLMVDDARKTIASTLKTTPDCIFFTSCATESNNTAIFGTAATYGRRKKKIVISGIEHPSAARCADRLESDGFEVVRIMPDENGIISADDIVSAVDEKTCLVSCMLVNNENGYILPIPAAFSAIKRKYPDVILHCDAVQGFLKIPFNAKTLNADLISISGHKIFAPKGVGVLYVRKGVRIAPLILGGNQEKGLRSGTENVILINSLKRAVEAYSGDIEKRFEKATALKRQLLSIIDDIDGAYCHTSDNHSPYIISITVENIKSETLLHFLEEREIYVSSGSACSKGKKSDILKAFRYSDKALDSTVRVSITADTTTEELETLCREIINAKESLCKIRGY